MANGVKTEWFDLQVQHGNYLPKEKEPTLAEVHKAVQEIFEEESKLENRLDRKDITQIQ